MYAHGALCIQSRRMANLLENLRRIEAVYGFDTCLGPYMRMPAGPSILVHIQRNSVATTNVQSVTGQRLFPCFLPPLSSERMPPPPLVALRGTYVHLPTLSESPRPLQPGPGRAARANTHPAPHRTAPAPAAPHRAVG